MSIAYVTEFVGLVPSPGGPPGIAMQPPVAEQAITFTTTAGTSAAFNAKTTVVRIAVDGIANVLFSTAGTAAVLATNMRMSAGQSEYFGVPPGQGYKISFVTAGA
jgi:hypothetical protein